MDTPQRNALGYKRSSVLHWANKLPAECVHLPLSLSLSLSLSPFLSLTHSLSLSHCLAHLILGRGDSCWYTV